MRLFHVSDRAGIACFEPRAASDGRLKVWAIEDRTLANYLLPRECPRVCARPRADSSAADVALLDGADALIAVEAAWMERIVAAVLWLSAMPATGFTLEDRIAGYWTSADAVLPLRSEAIAGLPRRIAEHGACLIVLPSLWPLHDRVAASSLDFSMIRMRNAAPR